VIRSVIEIIELEEALTGQRIPFYLHCRIYRVFKQSYISIMKLHSWKKFQVLIFITCLTRQC